MKGGETTMTYQAPELVQVGVATDLVLGGGSGGRDQMSGHANTPLPMAVLGLDE
jgi:hypothetical protein